MDHWAPTFLRAGYSNVCVMFNFKILLFFFYILKSVLIVRAPIQLTRLLYWYFRFTNFELLRHHGFYQDEVYISTNDINAPSHVVVVLHPTNQYLNSIKPELVSFDNSLRMHILPRRLQNYTAVAWLTGVRQTLLPSEVQHPTGGIHRPAIDQQALSP